MKQSTWLRTSVEAFVYVWHYALLVVHARKEEHDAVLPDYLLHCIDCSFIIQMFFFRILT